MKENKYIHVRVKTKAKTANVLTKKGKYYIEVKERAERGMANKKVKELLAQSIGCNTKELRLIKGAQTPSKTYLIAK